MICVQGCIALLLFLLPASSCDMLNSNAVHKSEIPLREQNKWIQSCRQHLTVLVAYALLHQSNTHTHNITWSSSVLNKHFIGIVWKIDGSKKNFTKLILTLDPPQFFSPRFTNEIQKAIPSTGFVWVKMKCTFGAIQKSVSTNWPNNPVHSQ